MSSQAYVLLISRSSKRHHVQIQSLQKRVQVCIFSGFVKVWRSAEANHYRMHLLCRYAPRAVSGMPRRLCPGEQALVCPLPVGTQETPVLILLPSPSRRCRGQPFLRREWTRSKEKGERK